MRIILLLLFIFTGIYSALSQPFNLPLNNYYNLQIEREVNAVDSDFHTAVRPYNFKSVDSSWFDMPQYDISRRTWAGRVMGNFLNDYLIRVDTGDFFLRVSPIFNFEVGKQLTPEKSLYTNTRGFLVNGAITKNFTFTSSFYENQASFPRYLTSYIRAYSVVPGQGRARGFKGNTAFDYGMSDANVTFSPGKYFLFQLGHGKHFIGDGYRSLLLSDNAFNYPYFKIETNIWKIKYVNLFAQFQDIIPGSVLGKGYPKKFGSFHYLSVNIGKRLNVGLFESIIWRAGDSANARGFDFNYINPVIFYRPVEFSLGSADNAMMGMNLKYKAADRLTLYGQFILDDFNFKELKNRKGFYQQKYGYQLGIKSYDLLLKKSLLRLEYNQVQPYVFSHKLARQNYVHYNQPLAHPLMANFREFVIAYNVNVKRWLFEAKNVHALVGKDRRGENNGNNIFIPEMSVDGFPRLYDNKVLQGLRTNINYFNVSAGYLINPVLNMRLEGGYVIRTESNSSRSIRDNFVYVSFKTALRNYYYDF